MNLMSSSCGGDGNQDRQEVPKCTDGDDHDMEANKESPSGANKEKQEDEFVTVMLGRCTPAAESAPLIIIEEMEEMFLRLGFSSTVTQKLVDDQEIDSPQTLMSLSDEDITAMCNMSRWPCGLVSSKTPDRRNQISVFGAKTEACSIHVQVDGMLLQCL